MKAKKILSKSKFSLWYGRIFFFLMWVGNIFAGLIILLLVLREFKIL